LRITLESSTTRHVFMDQPFLRERQRAGSVLVGSKG